MKKGTGVLAILTTVCAVLVIVVVGIFLANRQRQKEEAKLNHQQEQQDLLEESFDSDNSYSPNVDDSELLNQAIENINNGGTRY